MKGEIEEIRGLPDALRVDRVVGLEVWAGPAAATRFPLLPTIANVFWCEISEWFQAYCKAGQGG